MNAANAQFTAQINSLQFLTRIYKCSISKGNEKYWTTSVCVCGQDNNRFRNGQLIR